jgi:hypothetical protein
VLHRA